MKKKRRTSAGSETAWPLFERPGFLARRVHQIHVSLFSEICADAGVTPVQYSLMSVLVDRNVADQTTLARIVALDRTTTTGALKRLQARGLVQRVTSKEDRRSQACRLTPAGRALVASMEASARRAHEATVEPLTKSEQRHLIALLKRIVAAHDERRQKPELL